MVVPSPDDSWGEDQDDEGEEDAAQEVQDIRDILASMSRGIVSMLKPPEEEVFPDGFRPKRLIILRDPDRSRDSASEVDVIAAGVQMPSGAIHIEWNREAFEEDERASHTVESRYESVEDAEQASSGTLLFFDYED